LYAGLGILLTMAGHSLGSRVGDVLGSIREGQRRPVQQPHLALSACQLDVRVLQAHLPLPAAAAAATAAVPPPPPLLGLLCHLP